MNKDVLSADGKVDMSAGGNPIVFPMDVTAVINNAASASSASSAPAASGSSTASAGAAGSSASTTPAGNTNGARGTAVSTALLGAGFLAATFLAL